MNGGSRKLIAVAERQQLQRAARFREKCRKAFRNGLHSLTVGFQRFGKTRRFERFTRGKEYRFQCGTFKIKFQGICSSFRGGSSAKAAGA